MEEEVNSQLGAGVKGVDSSGGGVGDSEGDSEGGGDQAMSVGRGMRAQ